MGQLLHSRMRFSVIILLLMLIGIFAACAPNPRGQLISPNMVPEGSGQVFVPPTPTPIPNIAELSEEEVLRGLAPDFVTLLASADPMSGQQLSTANGCFGCHNLDPSQVVVAPSWYNMANTAIIRNPASEGPAAYLYHSIVAPNDYLVQGYNAGLMPQNYQDTLSSEQLADMVAYLLTLRGDAP
jgi:mono/diheme cytochrome c family protein